MEAVGKDVTTATVGDEVFGVGIGSFAEYAVASAAKIAPKPAPIADELSGSDIESDWGAEVEEESAGGVPWG